MSASLRSGAAELPPVCRLIGESAARLMVVVVVVVVLRFVVVVVVVVILRVTGLIVVHSYG